MCGRFVATTSPSSLMDRFRADDVVTAMAPRWNVAPTDPANVVVEERGRRVIDAYRWGLIPPWATDDRDAAKRINARAETLADKPAFRESFVRRRCIVPADGFYEWRRSDGARPQPFFIRPRPANDTALALAGLWAEWIPGRNGPPQLFDDIPTNPVRSCTIITTDANTAVAPLHDRMPVVLPADAWDEWLDPAYDDTTTLQHLLVPAPDDLLDLVAVGFGVNDVRNDGPHLVEAASAAARDS